MEHVLPRMLGTTARRRMAVFVIAWVGLTIAGCSNPPGDDETDRVAQVVSDAIVYPRQADAAGLARAALATHAGQDGRLEVLSYTDLARDNHSRLLLRVHHDGAQAGFSSTPPVVACYSVTFDYYQAINGPKRVECPVPARPVTPPAAPPGPTVDPFAGG